MYLGTHWTFTNAWNKPMNLVTTLKLLIAMKIFHKLCKPLKKETFRNAQNSTLSHWSIVKCKWERPEVAIILGLILIL